MTLTVLLPAGMFPRLMTNGVRVELIRELKRIGTRYADVAELLEVALIVLPELPANAVYALDAPAAVLTVADDDTIELSAWAGLAHFVAIDLEIDVDFYDILDVASVMCVSSGVMPRVCVGA